MTTPCTNGAARWEGATEEDPGAQQLCRSVCPLRQRCAEIAMEIFRASPQLPTGIWAGEFLPDASDDPMGRVRALKRIGQQARGVA